MIKIIKEILAVSGHNSSKLKYSLVLTFLRAFSSFLPIAGLLLILMRFPKIKLLTVVVSTCIVLVGVLINAWSRKGIDMAQSGTGYCIFADQRIRIGELLKRLPLGFFTDNQHRDLIGIVTSTINDLEQLSMQVFDKVTQALIMGFVLDVFLLIFNWQIGLISIAGELISFLVFQRILNISEVASVQRQEAQASMVTKVNEFIQGIAVAKSFEGNNFYSPMRNVYDSFINSRQTEINLVKKNVGWMAAFELIVTITSSLVASIAIYFILIGQLSLASGVAVFISSFIMYSPFHELAGISSTVQVVHASLRQVNDLLNEKPIDDKGQDIIPKNTDLELKNVSFSYENSSHPTLNNINLKIPQGEKLAIIGPSGSGKSTLCELLMRFWEVSQGKITLGGKNIKAYKLSNLLQYFAMVFQDTYLFNDTIANNIRFGKPSATMEEVKLAAKKAYCADFIETLPQGYETVVTNGGDNFSGGQKQRLSIARAILKDPPIIIFDEATASLDPENEKKIMAAIATLGRHKTVITIAHQLKTISKADQILVLKNGNMIQLGTHDQLYQEKGLYQDFVKNLRKVNQWELGKRLTKN